MPYTAHALDYDDTARCPDCGVETPDDLRCDACFAAEALSVPDDLAGPADLDFSGAAEKAIPVPIGNGVRHVHHTSRRTRALRGSGGVR